MTKVPPTAYAVTLEFAQPSDLAAYVESMQRDPRIRAVHPSKAFEAWAEEQKVHPVPRERPRVRRPVPTGQR